MAKKQGRPLEYSPRFAIWARSLAIRGLSKIAIAKEMGLSRATLYLWADAFPEFSDALNTAKSEAAAIVSEALYKRAVGYKYEEKTKTVSSGSKGRVVKVTEKDVEVLPDPRAAIWWLSNIDPDNWALNGKEPEAIGVNNRLNRLLDVLEGGEPDGLE